MPLTGRVSPVRANSLEMAEFTGPIERDLTAGQQQPQRDRFAGFAPREVVRSVELHCMRSTGKA